MVPRAEVPWPPARALPLGLRSSRARCAPSTEHSRCCLHGGFAEQVCVGVHIPLARSRSHGPGSRGRQVAERGPRPPKPASFWVCDASPWGFTPCSGGHGGLVRCSESRSPEEEGHLSGTEPTGRAEGWAGQEAYAPSAGVCVTRLRLRNKPPQTPWHLACVWACGRLGQTGALFGAWSASAEAIGGPLSPWHIIMVKWTTHREPTHKASDCRGVPSAVSCCQVDVTGWRRGPQWET